MKHLYLLAACCMFLLQVCAQDTVYSSIGITVAGGNDSGFAPRQLNAPRGVAFDAAGNLYVADFRNNRIQRWTPGATDGVTIAGGNGIGPAANQLNNPSDLCFDAAGNMYVADTYNSRIQKFVPGSREGVTVSSLLFPWGITIDVAGNLYILNIVDHCVEKLAPGSTSRVVVAGISRSPGSAANQLNNPQDVFVDTAGNIYVADQGNFRVQKWAPGATAGVTVAGGRGYGTAANQLGYASGVAVDAKGNVFVTDIFVPPLALNARLQKWAPGATAGVTIAGGNGIGSAANQFAYAGKLAIDAAGNLYVSDADNHRIQKFRLGSSTYPASTRICPDDIVVPAASCTGKTIIRWTAPRDSFPDYIFIPPYLDPHQGQLKYMGSLNGHGYYQSYYTHTWSDARYICEFIGDTGVNGHLATITSAAENLFINNNLVGTPPLYPWIGLYSTGKPGSFRWVTGEPLAYTNWASGEPNNFTGNAAYVAEPHVHRYPSGQWNDQRRISLPFLAEFDEPLIRYRQISGVSNGSEQSPGVYMICYERTNRISGVKDTCCFSVTIQCPAAGNTTQRSAQTTAVAKPAH